jgi:DNA-binding transcriptional MerR regulator
MIDVNVNCARAPTPLPNRPQSSVSPTRTFAIAELAAEFDITPRAIRFYEDVGLLEPARAGRNRVYSQRDRTRLKLTLRGKRLGLALQEIKQLVDMYDSPADGAAQLTAFLGVLGEHRRLLEQQMEDIHITLAEIGQHEARCRELLGKARKRIKTKETMT